MFCCREYRDEALFLRNREVSSNDVGACSSFTLSLLHVTATCSVELITLFNELIVKMNLGR
jgi:hypothetical protein